MLKPKLDIPNIIPSTGCIPSPLDKRDVLSSEIVPEIKRKPVENPCPFDLDILYQNGLPACVGFAGSGMEQYLTARRRINKIFDGEWGYKECKKVDNYDGPGTYLRTMLSVLTNVGAKPIGEPESEAWKYRIDGYAKVDPLTFDELQKMISVYGVVLMGFTGSNPGWKTADVRPPMTGEVTWGHAVFGKSYKETKTDFQNSWDETWGDNGVGHFDKNYLPFEAWVILDHRPSDLLPDVIEKSGWVADKYVVASKYIAGQPVKTTANGLRLRKEPSLAGNILSSLQKGQELIVTGEGVECNNYNWIPVKVV